MKKSPFWLMFGPGLLRIFCDHAGKHNEWGYERGSGVCELICHKCGKVIKRITLDDLPHDTLVKLIKALEKKREEDENDLDD